MPQGYEMPQGYMEGMCFRKKEENNESGPVYFFKFHMLPTSNESLYNFTRQVHIYILMIIEFPEKDEDLKENIDGALDAILG